jgi:hypothetical protein
MFKGFLLLVAECKEIFKNIIDINLTREYYTAL